MKRATGSSCLALGMGLCVFSLVMAGEPSHGTPLNEHGRLSGRIAADAGSAEAPLLFGIGMHIEPHGATPSALVGPSSAQGLPRRDGPGFRRGPDYHIRPFFRRDVEHLRLLASIVEKHGGKLTVQGQTPFTRVAVESGETVFAELEERGHEIGLHFHEDAHLGRGGATLPVKTWAAVIKEEIELLREAGATRVRFWSGGNLYPGVLEAAARAGLEIMGDYKNPRTQQSDERLLTVSPWRPTGGPRETDLSEFARHNPKGEIVFLPSGVFGRADYASARRSAKMGGDWGYFDLLTDGLERSLLTARQDRVNVFRITVHPGEFRGRRGEGPFAVIDEWLGQVVDPLVKAGKVRWATFSEMADAFIEWEKEHPGVDPRQGEGAKGEAYSTAEGEKRVGSDPTGAKKSPERRPRGHISFCINVHDLLHVDESAETLLRLISLFEKHDVLGDFYVTAPMVRLYTESRPDVIKRLKESGMTISYHVRPPHPLNKGFSRHLGGWMMKRWRPC